MLQDSSADQDRRETDSNEANQRRLESGQHASTSGGEVFPLDIEDTPVISSFNPPAQPGQLVVTLSYTGDMGHFAVYITGCLGANPGGGGQGVVKGRWQAAVTAKHGNNQTMRTV